MYLKISIPWEARVLGYLTGLYFIGLGTEPEDDRIRIAGFPKRYQFVLLHITAPKKRTKAY
jgi:hypothetical protein